MLDLWSFLILLCLELIAGLLRWAHQALDTNRDEDGYFGANELKQEVHELRVTGNPQAACWLEITSLAPVVLPLLGTSLRRNSGKIEAFSTAFVGLGVGLNGLAFGLFLNRDAHWFRALKSTAPRPDDWQNSLVQAGLLSLAVGLGFLGVICVALVSRCRSRKCRASGICTAQLAPQQRLAWCVVAYGVEATALVAAPVFAGLVPVNALVVAPALALTISILTLGNLMADQGDGLITC